MALTLNEIADRAHEQAIKSGWYAEGKRNVLELLMLITTELAEAAEAYRNNEMNLSFVGEKQKPEGFGIEIADAIIRIADMAKYLQLDLDQLVLTKMDFNSRRSYRHGNKRA